MNDTTQEVPTTMVASLILTPLLRLFLKSTECFPANLYVHRLSALYNIKPSACLLALKVTLTISIQLNYRNYDADADVNCGHQIRGVLSRLSLG